MESRSNAIFASLDLGAGSVRVAVKDCIDVAGSVTSSGCEALAGEPPPSQNAEVVDRIVDGGMRIIGKANMHPLAYGVTGQNEWLGTPINPHYPDRICGGSSSGSAVAVASGEADIALGTDTGGSVRMPAACCGVAGLKPSFGLVSRVGVKPPTSSLDCVGPFARSVAEIEQAMCALAPDFVPVEAGSLASIELGLVNVTYDPSAQKAVNNILDRSGVASSSVDLPSIDAAHKAGLVIIAREAWLAYRDLIDDPRLPRDIAIRLRSASSISDEDIAQAEQTRVTFRSEVDDVLTRFDALVLPAMPGPAPLLENARDPANIVDQTRLLRPFNLSGHPALCLPMADASDAPIGLQLVGKMQDDARLCAIGRLLEPHCTHYAFEETVQ